MPAPIAKPLVLLLEDHAETRHVTTRLLELDGFEVRPASCARDALRHAVRERFHVALLDIVLPDGAGTSVARAIRRVQPDACLIAVTAAAGPDEMRCVRASGFERVLLKPLDPAGLAAAVRAACATPPRSSLRERIGANVRRRRLRLGIAVPEAASAARIPAERWRHVEAGRGGLTAEQLMRLASVLCCTTASLTAPVPPANPPPAMN